MNIYDYKVKDMSNNEVSLSEYKDKVLLIVNTATGCGFTPQYTGLEAMYKKYKDKGFEILDFPCNQFLGQAPGTAEQIHTFCTSKYNISFKQFAKIEVNGKNEEPLYTYLKEQQKGFGGSKIKWNFTKFLVARDGKIVKRFGPATTPEKIDKEVKKLI